MLSKKNTWTILHRMFRYNLRIVFANKFYIFVLAAFGFYLLFGTLMALNENSIELDEIFGLMLFPALLLVFYPTVFGIQTDADARSLEIIFGIPDYRYKVWLVRLVIVFLIVFVLLFPFAIISNTFLMTIPILEMNLQLMVVVIFIGSLSFGVSTIVKNGNGTAVVMVIVGLVFLIFSDSLDESMWNIFLNPFDIPRNMNEIIWEGIIFKSRVFLLSTSVVMILLGLLNLQTREKFLK